MTKNQQLYLSLLESIKTPENQADVSYLQETFVITEAFRLPDIQNLTSRAIQAKKDATKAPTTDLSDDEIAARNKAFRTESGKAGRTRGLVSGYMAQIEKYAVNEPFAVEEWIDNVLNPLIKDSKQNLDNKLGTESAKRGILDRAKSAFKAFSEAEDM